MMVILLSSASAVKVVFSMWNFLGLTPLLIILFHTIFSIVKQLEDLFPCDNLICLEVIQKADIKSLCGMQTSCIDQTALSSLSLPEFW